MPTLAYAAQSAGAALAPVQIERRALRPQDVAIDILFCGVCHSDLHMARGEWPISVYPCVPGHEIVGRVRAIGPDVAGVAVGDVVGVGCMVDSCRTCPSCADGLEQYCESGSTATYNSPDRLTGENTLGGYARDIVVDADFVLRIDPGVVDLAGVAPLLCAGITMWSPLRAWHIGAGHRVGIVGLGGLGHIGIKLATALGAAVTVFTSSPGKRAEAIRLGADHALLSDDAEAMATRAGAFDLILDTVAAPHDLDRYTGLLKRDGTMVLVGLPADPHPAPSIFNLIFGRRRLAGSTIGGIAETQEMLDFCAARGIICDTELIAIDDVDAAFDRMQRGEVRYRFVIDMASLAGE